MIDEPSAPTLAEQIGAVEETIAELQVDPLLYHDQAGPVIDLRIARLTAVIATLKERAAAYRRGIAGGWSEAKRAAENAVIESPMSDPDRRMLRQKIRALAPPQEGS